MGIQPASLNLLEQTLSFLSALSSFLLVALVSLSLLALSVF